MLSRRSHISEGDREGCVFKRYEHGEVMQPKNVESTRGAQEKQLVLLPG